jgi:hypothetical protein
MMLATSTTLHLAMTTRSRRLLTGCAAGAWMLGAAGMLAAPSMTVVRSGLPSTTVVRSLGDTSRQSLTARLVPLLPGGITIKTLCQKVFEYAMMLTFWIYLQISGEIPGASPDHHMMSPTGNIGRRAPFPYMNHSCMFISQNDFSCLRLHLFDVKI